MQYVFRSELGVVLVQSVRGSGLGAEVRGELGAGRAVQGVRTGRRHDLRDADCEGGLGDRAEAVGGDPQADRPGAAVLWPGEDELGDGVQRAAGRCEIGDGSALGGRRWSRASWVAPLSGKARRVNDTGP